MTQKYPLWQAPFVGYGKSEEFWLILAGLYGVVSQLVLHAQVPRDVAGPVGIAQPHGTVCRSWTTRSSVFRISFISKSRSSKRLANSCA